MYFRWCQLVLTLLADLHKHHIIHPALLSHFLNSINRGLLFCHYLKARIAPNLNPSALYLNFHPKLSLQHDPSTKPFSGLFRCQSSLSHHVIRDPIENDLYPSSLLFPKF